ncbi:hypothetical protein BTO20_00940 [Mycobacterium dioxanotrophicus]|jgi:hypothetical protein|uniref:Uncharacterized protein n=1 Tax=Mycobacterium dioxanotrophicus TaxID=482462 RepID=A0A1Y0BWQ6_9MYCO|nr:hypothetical protein [Mycobacterium dioxanotrophicus]ART67351.1 hypothetical protein BTO20_00940 [Mycobacterium dioxanotrophicus]
MMLELASWFADLERASGTTDVIEQATKAANDVFALHPEEILRFLEESWAYGSQSLPGFQLPPALLYGQAPGFESGLHKRLSAVNGTIYGTLPTWASAPPPDSGTGARWDHLIYAYLIENTRLLPIFFRVVTEFLHGERLEVPSPATQQWLRTTEALFMRDLPSRSIGAITSSVRPDLEATRRNAYYRLFGVDLNHGANNGAPYSYVRAQAANTGLIRTFEDFLREVWTASENYRNTSGINSKDDAAIATHARDMQDMLTTRRRFGNLAREEFVIVSMLSWFDLTLESNNSVVVDLKATAASPEERLRKIGERVGLAPHAQSESFFRLAPRMSPLFRHIEEGVYNSISAVSALYADPTSGPPNQLRRDMLDIINQWSIATGRDMKAKRTTPTPRTAPVNGRALLAVGNGSAAR